MQLDAELVQHLAGVAETVGVLGLAAVSLDHPGFAWARAELDRHLDEGLHGEMDFMARTREVRKDPRAMLASARSIVIGVVPYRGTADPVARYAQSIDYHQLLHRRFEAIEQAIHLALPAIETLVGVDTKPVMERSAAVLAGLGFLGKNGCLITPGLGSYVLLGEMLTSAEVAIPPMPPLGKLRYDACGSCSRCLEACPTQAFLSAGRLDPRRCIAYLTIEHRGTIADDLLDAIGVRIAGCDVCQEVCPYNASPSRNSRVAPHAWPEDLPEGPRSTDLATLANVTSGRYRAFVRDTALRRIPRNALRRNALVALGNITTPPNPREREAMDAAHRDPDPRVQAAASRAIRRRSTPNL